MTDFKRKSKVRDLFGSDLEQQRINLQAALDKYGTIRNTAHNLQISEQTLHRLLNQFPDLHAARKTTWK